MSERFIDACHETAEALRRQTKDPAMTQDPQKMLELRLCPFCGGSQVYLHCFDAGHMYWVSCRSCGLEAPTETGVTKEQAIAYWNTRTASERLAATEEREALAYAAFKFLEWRGIRKDRDDFVQSKWLDLPDENQTGPCNIDCNCDHTFYGKNHYRKLAGALSIPTAPAGGNVIREALEDIISWKHDTLGPRPNPSGPEYDARLTEAFDRGARMAFYRCADRAANAIAAFPPQETVKPNFHGHVTQADIDRCKFCTPPPPQETKPIGTWGYDAADDAFELWQKTETGKAILVGIVYRRTSAEFIVEQLNAQRSFDRTASPIPRADADGVKIGWRLDYKWLENLCNEIEKVTGYQITMECAEEAVLRTETLLVSSTDRELCPDWRTCKCKDGCAHSSTHSQTGGK